MLNIVTKLDDKKGVTGSAQKGEESRKRVRRNGEILSMQNSNVSQRGN